MSTAPTVLTPDLSPQRNPGTDTPAARVSFRRPISRAGFIDAAWWPRSLDLVAELPALLDVLWTAGRKITRVTYNLGLWDPAPRRIQHQGRTVRLGGFATSDAFTVRLTDAQGGDRIDVLVVVPDTDAALAERTLQLASATDSPYRAPEILSRAGQAGAA
jgi:Family of unknown function (DUF5994)